MKAFATSSEKWGSNSWDYGKGMYPVKLYNSSSVLIYQVDNGGDNTNSKPSGGVLVSSTAASSMSVAIANPIIFYGESPVISQAGQSSDIYNYYWSSYSRGTDGRRLSEGNSSSWHNDYLDSYIPSRHKSIYDPCPYGYRTPSHGTYNEFTTTGWTFGSYTGGVAWNKRWLPSLGARAYKSGLCVNTGCHAVLITSTPYVSPWVYVCTYSQSEIVGKHEPKDKSNGYVIRCIEDCSVVSDATEASAGY